MIVLRLFHQTDPFRQVDQRRLDAGATVIGRGEDADWTLADPTRLLSRRHCSITVEGESVALEDMSANGVFVGPARQRATSHKPMPLKSGETLRLGDYIIIVDHEAGPIPAPHPDLHCSASAALRAVEVLAEQVHTDARSLGDPAGAVRAARERQPDADEGALLEAFCAGAHIDPSAFADEDPAAVMRRLGAIYRQMVFGLTDLMDERTSVKTEYRMDRTTVRAAGNNPFRWANAQRVAIDLLRSREDGFLSDFDAVKVSFADVKKHLICVMAGAKATLDATLKTLSPSVIEKDLPASAGFLKGRASVAWAQYAAAHKVCEQELASGVDGLSNREFGAAYARKLQELDDADEAGK